MVPNLSKGAGIKGTALYVLHDKRTEEDRALGAALTPAQQTQHRIGMTATRNLSTDDPELAWRLMCATAANRDALKEAAGVHRGGNHSKNQCGHISLSWELQTKPDAAEMERAAAGALKALGWEHCQALIVEHRDEEHSHVHLVVNLIDPETGRTAPNARNDYEKLQRWAHEYDRARGIEACPQRAARMEPQPDRPPPAAPAQRWLSRKEYEALRATERAEHRTQALDRYRTAAAEVREQFRPEWAGLYREQRAELRDFDQAAKHRLTALRQATHPDQMLAFVNENRERIWRGIMPGQEPGNNHTMLAPSFVKRALDHADRVERFTIIERHGLEKGDLQERHTEARQDAYRQAWQRPQVAEAVPSPGKAPETAQEAPSGRDNGKVGLAAALAVSAAGIAAYALHMGRAAEPGRDPQRDLDAAAQRIDRQQGRAANANVPPKVERAPETKPSTEPKPATPPVRDEVAILRARIERERKDWQARQGPEPGFRAASHAITGLTPPAAKGNGDRVPQHPKLAKAPETGRPVIVIDGIYSGRIATVLSAGGGLVWIRIAGVDEPVPLPTASVEAAARQASIVDRPPRA